MKKREAGSLRLVLAAVLILILIAGVVVAQVMQGVDATKRPTPVLTETPSTSGNPGRLIPAIQQQTKQLDAMDAATGWAALSTDTTGLATDLDHVEGSNSLEFDKVDGAADGTVCGIGKTLTSVDLTDYIASGGALSYSVNVSALTDIAYCFLRLGTSSSHYNEWRVDDDALSTGWNWVRFNVYAPSTAGATGNGITWTAVTYAAVGCVFDAETDTLADLRFDSLEIIRGLQGTVDTAGQVSSSTAVSDVNVTELGSQSIDLGSGAIGTGTQRVTIATDDEINDDLDTIAGDTTSLDGKVTTTDADTGAGTDTIPEVVCMLPGSGGASMPDVGAGNVAGGTPRVTLATDDPAVVALQIIDDWDDGSDHAQVDIAAQTLTAVKVSDDANANAINNPMYFQISADGTNAVSATYPLPISATASANATGNRIWVAANVDQIGGTAVNVNGGAKDAGTQTVILATDDPAVVALQLIDDWDEVHDSAVGTDGALVMGEAHTAAPAAVDDADAVRLALNEYGQVILAGYSFSTGATSTTESSPVSTHHAEETLCTLTNVAANTTGYCGYVDMDGYKTLGVHCIAGTDPTDTMTYTIECSLQDDGTASASCSYVDSTMSFKEMGGHDHNASYVDEETILISYFDIPVKSCRVKYVTSDTGGSDADLTCWIKRLY